MAANLEEYEANLGQIPSDIPRKRIFLKNHKGLKLFNENCVWVILFGRISFGRISFGRISSVEYHSVEYHSVEYHSVEF